MMAFRPDWTLTLREQIAVTLSLSMARHVPTWGGATDEQLDAVAADVVEVLSSTAEGVEFMRDALWSARDTTPFGVTRSAYNDACDRLDVLASRLREKK